MYIINSSQLKEGDILLTRSSSRESQLIRQITSSDYSHAILYVGIKSCIESDGLGVQSQNIQRLLFENNDDVTILRLKDSDNNITKAIEFARQKVGTEYSTSEARLARLEKEISAKEPNRQFCTRFVAQAFNHAGILLVENPDYCSPQEILESEKLNMINDILRVATEKEIEYAKSESPLEKQIEIHNIIFESTRNILNRDVQNFEQLANELIKQPEKDSEIVKVIKDSGYLEMWKKDVNKNPWFYDFENFLEHIRNPKQILEIGTFLSTTEKTTRSRFIETKKFLEKGYKYSGLEYFKIEIELYDKLIELSKTRENIGLLALALITKN